MNIRPEIIFKHTFISFLVALSVLMPLKNALGYSTGGPVDARYRENAAGIAMGIPQTIALTYERTLGSRFAARIHMGSAILYSSVGARLLWRQNGNGFHPYLFAGTAFIYAVAEGYGDPEGTSGYIWSGTGLSLRQNRWAAYTEAGALLGGNDDRGLGDDWVFPFSPVIAAGLMIRF